MGIFDKSNYIVNISQVFQCTAKVILLAKTIKRINLEETKPYSSLSFLYCSLFVFNDSH